MNPADDTLLHSRLVEWSHEPRRGALEFRSFAAVFAGPLDLDERGFEDAMWERLSALTAIDRMQGFTHAPGYSENPHEPTFALSFGGNAYFAVGLHPRASRTARRAPAPTIVFNSHDQFTELRKANRYERMRQAILARDAALDGEPNPMLSRHGEASEAPQYSGRAVGSDWICPFAPTENDDSRAGSPGGATKFPGIQSSINGIGQTDATEYSAKSIRSATSASSKVES